MTCMQDMYMKIACVIRDFKVVVERDRVLGFSGYRTPKGLSTNTKYYVYLPRVSYKRNRSKEQIKRENDFEKQNRNFAGSDVHMFVNFLMVISHPKFRCCSLKN